VKQKILEALAAGRAKEQELMALCVDAPPDPGGIWSAKDHVAHLAAWRDRTARVIDSVRTAEAPPATVEDEPENARIYAETRSRNLDEIKGEADASWDRVTAAVEASSDADLARPHPEFPDHEVWEAVPGLVGHLGTHLMWWHLEAGDQGAAEAAAVWAYNFERNLLTDPRQQADANYNLGCFYSRTGKSERAIALVRESLASAPYLVEIARKDPDLDLIRDQLGDVLN
jgi:hypothetical protein